MPTIGYIPGLDYGKGFDRMGALVRGEPVIRTTPEAVPDTDLSQSSHTSLRIAESQEDLDRVLGISAEADAGIQHIAGGGTKFDFSQECCYQANSLWLIAYVSVINSVKAMRDVQLKPEAVELLRNGHEERFREQYGDFFVLGMQTGGQLVVVLEIETTSTFDLTQVGASITGSGLIGGVPVEAAASVQSKLAQATFGRKTYLSIYQIGGIQGEPMMRSTSVDIASLIEHIFTFPAQVSGGRSAALAVVTLDYKALTLPVEPNWVERLNARQVLDAIMTQRQDALALLNKVNYILLHADQFASFNSQEYTSYAHQLSVAITTLTKAASNCVNAPKDAQLPQNIVLPPITNWPERKDGTPVPQPIQVSHSPLTEAQQLRQWAMTTDQTPIPGWER